MLKVLIYGYLTSTYSSRKIEEALHQNIHFMWLRGMQHPVTTQLTGSGVIPEACS
jgi:transposase